MSNYYTFNLETSVEVYCFNTSKEVEMFNEKLVKYQECDDLNQWSGGLYLPETLHNLIETWGCPEGVKSQVSIVFYDDEQSLEWLNEPIRI